MANNQSWKQLRQRWLWGLIVLLIATGVVLRFVNLDRKVYWADEAYTSLRISGYTEREFIRTAFTGDRLTVAELQRYQHPTSAKTWGDAFRAFRGNAEHSPLYFLLARVWVQFWGSSIATIRALSACISLLAFPALYWLCRELFASRPVTAVALAFLAISPLHILYAQEARQYSLWTVTTLFSGAALLWTLRTQTRRSWSVYALSIALGLYSHLLFALVAIAQAVYVAVQEKWRLSKVTLAYLLSTLAGVTLFLPWLIVAFLNLERIQKTTASLNLRNSLSHVFDRWFLNLNLVFVNQDLGSANLILVAIAAVALWFLCSTAPRRTWLFVLLLVAVTSLPLAFPDLVMGGQRSLRVRYLIPCYLGVQIAIAYLLTTLSIHWRGWQQSIGRVLLVALLVASLMGCLLSVDAEVWWNKSRVRTSYFPGVARIINQANRPLVVSDAVPIDILSFSHELKPNVQLQLARIPGKIRIAENVKRLYLFNSSNRLRNRLVKVYGFRATRAYTDESGTRLWRLDRPAVRPE
jgi:uncharacterized membrane protein